MDWLCRRPKNLILYSNIEREAQLSVTVAMVLRLMEVRRLRLLLFRDGDMDKAVLSSRSRSRSLRPLNTFNLLMTSVDRRLVK